MRTLRTARMICRGRGRRLVGCALVLCIALPAGASAGGAPFPVALTVSGMTVAGAPQVTVMLRTATRARCTLEVSAAGRHRMLATRTTGRDGVALWRWRPRGLPGRRAWRFTATCRRGREWSARWIPVELGFPSATGALAADPSLRPATPGASCDAQGLCFAGDPFPVGQCTWFAAGRRPDLLGIVSGDAGGWLTAARGRAPEGWFPVVGSLAVWLPDHGGADAQGHVAYVAGVSANGRILVYDSNWRMTASSPGLEVHEHWVRATSPSGFIYGGPAGAGPAG